MSSRATSVSSMAGSQTQLNQPQEPENIGKRYFTVYLFATVMSITACVIVGILVAMKAGFYWSDTQWGDEAADKMFSFHPLFMTIAMIFLNSQAAMMYRTLRHKKFSAFTIKIFHAGFQGGTFIMVVFGLHAAFRSFRMNNLANINDAHGWMGIILIIIFVLQLVFGFIAFLFPGAARQTRLWYLQYHRFFGTVVLLLSVVVVCMGMSIYQVKGYGAQGILSRVYVIAVVLYAIAIGFIFANNKFQSPIGSDAEAKSIYADINGQGVPSYNQ